MQAQNNAQTMVRHTGTRTRTCDVTRCIGRGLTLLMQARATTTKAHRFPAPHMAKIASNRVAVRLFSCRGATQCHHHFAYQPHRSHSWLGPSFHHPRPSFCQLPRFLVARCLMRSRSSRSHIAMPHFAPNLRLGVWGGHCASRVGNRFCGWAQSTDAMEGVARNDVGVCRFGNGKV